MHLVAIVNRKGGVGKTTTAVNIAAALALAGQRTLLVDLDPQGSVAASLALEPAESGSGEGFRTKGRLVPRYPAHPALFRLGVLTADERLGDEAVRTAVDRDRGPRLREALGRLRDHWAVVVLDTPPALGGLSQAALAIADAVVVPTTGDFLALEALRATLEAVRQAERERGAPFRPLLVLPTLVETRRASARATLDGLREQAGDLVATEVVPRSTRLEAAAIAGEPIVLASPKSAPAHAYTTAALAVLAGSAAAPRPKHAGRRPGIKAFVRSDMRASLRAWRTR